MLVAEAYWDLEWELQQQGFDFCYDKRLYDRIAEQDASAVRDHLRADLSYQSRLVRFLENHDEPRIASPPSQRAPNGPQPSQSLRCPARPCGTKDSSRAAACGPRSSCTRRPDEPPDLELAGWYRRLLATIADHHVREGAWRLLEAGGWPDNQSCRNLVTWSWAGDGRGARQGAVVNLSGESAQGRVPLDWPHLPGRSWHRANSSGRACSSGRATSWPAQGCSST